MAEKKNPLKNVKIAVRPSPAALKIVLIVLILLSMAALFALRWVHTGILAETENLKDKASALEEANADLQQKTAEIGSVQSVQDIAKEELGLVDPNTVILNPKP
jgi:cell division protein FtsL